MSKKLRVRTTYGDIVIQTGMVTENVNVPKWAECDNVTIRQMERRSR